MRSSRCFVQTAAATCVVLLSGLTATAQHDEMMPAEKPGPVMFMVSPLYGFNRNELTVPGHGRPGSPATVVDDTDAEMALFAMVVTPRVVANNILFRTEPEYGPQDPRGSVPEYAKVVGDIVSVNVYGAPESRLTWNVGAGYVWHEIDTDKGTTTIDMPLGKVGLVWRVPEMHVMFNPYVGYAREQVDVETPRGTVNEDSNVVLYGISGYWRWRMLQANVKYYIQDNRGRNKSYDVVRGQFSAMFNRHVGMLLRAERMEESSTTDTSLVAGPIFVF